MPFNFFKRRKTATNVAPQPPASKNKPWRVFKKKPKGEKFNPPWLRDAHRVRLEKASRKGQTPKAGVLPTKRIPKERIPKETKKPDEPRPWWENY
ncbi:MAG: hypothetical protein V1676_05490 [Candidatus Diapherotrites archaeon]